MPWSLEWASQGIRSMLELAKIKNHQYMDDLIQGAAGFRPVDAEFRVTPEFNINYLAVRENGIVRADVRDGGRRVVRQPGS